MAVGPLLSHRAPPFPLAPLVRVWGGLGWLPEQVVATCREHMPEWGAGAMDDRRLHVRYEDALAHLEATEVRLRYARAVL